MCIIVFRHNNFFLLCQLSKSKVPIMELVGINSNRNYSVFPRKHNRNLENTQKKILYEHILYIITNKKYGNFFTYIIYI